VIPGEKGQYGYVRLIEERGKKTKKTPKNDPLDLHGASASASTFIQTSTSAAGEPIYPASNRMYPQSAQIMAGDASRTTALTPMEESQEGSEWAIRIGDAPLPVWGNKRGLPQEDTLEDDHKRKKVDPGCVFRFQYSVHAHHQPTTLLACSSPQVSWAAC